MGDSVTFRTWHDDGMREAINVTKDAVIQQLVRDGLLTAEQAAPYLRDMHVEVQNPKWISQWWKKMFGKKDEQTLIILLKQLNISVEPSPTEPAPAEKTSVAT